MNLSRGLGELDYKFDDQLLPEEQMITSNPDIMVEEKSDCDYIVIACDGIWDTKKNEKVTSFILSRINEKKNLLIIADELLDDCLSIDPSSTNCAGTDNMLCIIIDLKNQMPD